MQFHFISLSLSSILFDTKYLIEITLYFIGIPSETNPIIVRSVFI